jgi:hypothetical protein
MKHTQTVHVQADNLWPFSKRHSWQSWRERYKKHKDEFDVKIRRLQKRAMSADSNMDATTSEQELPAHQTKGEIAIKRRSSARKLPSEEHSFLGLSEAEPSSIRKLSETNLSEDAGEKTVNEVQGSTELSTNGKRRGDGFDESTGREGKRRKRNGREVVFADELENRYVVAYVFTSVSISHIPKYAVDEQHRHRMRSSRP